MSSKISEGIERAAQRSHRQTAIEKLDLSFKYLDHFDELFFLEGMKGAWYEKLFNALHTIRQLTFEQFIRGDSLNAKPIGWGKSLMSRAGFPKPKDLKTEEEEAFYLMRERCFELRITTNSGRVHGFLHSNTFYVVWFDPAHNLFPGKQKLKKIEDYRQIKSCDIDHINSLTDEREHLKHQVESLTLELQSLNALIEEQTRPS